jgi:hypothetical protein
MAAATGTGEHLFPTWAGPGQAGIKTTLPRTSPAEAVLAIVAAMMSIEIKTPIRTGFLLKREFLFQHAWLSVRIRQKTNLSALKLRHESDQMHIAISL